MFEQDVRLGPGTESFTQHTFEILIMLLGAFLLGLWLGWVLWNRYKQALEKLRLDNQSLNATADALQVEIGQMKAKLADAELSNNGYRAEMATLKLDNDALREKLTNIEEDLEKTAQRNLQVETELGLAQPQDMPLTADEVPLEIVTTAGDAHDEPAEPLDLVAPPALEPEAPLDIAPDMPLVVAVTEEALEKPIKNSPKKEKLVASVADSIVPTADNPPVVGGLLVQDDLTVVEGIGPKIQMLLNQYNIHTYRQLADTSVDRLKEILAAAGPQLAMHDPGTWPSQANLAANDQWDALKSIQGFLKGGKKPT
jgi:predicted flap endonuclease-1-like 5' DNA nuclease